MRIINVIESTVHHPILSITSFGIFEEQLSDEVVEKARELFVEKAMENGIAEDDARESLEKNCIRRNDGAYSISIVWSDID